MPVAFEQVSFSYDGERDALEDIELVVDDGEFLGVIGHTRIGQVDARPAHERPARSHGRTGAR